ncbi:hypothetical protein RHS01_04068 [Rhizoctonia solani]|uniref:Expansin-like EG45 domain-containing protein n=1 Tax=Rhizoctonia solani TaxID=456999 RepID=A0A8H7IE69_9AGAM|nr:hypothetical protein RHS01_04068 [Rhizoctonia solani]
MSETVYNITIPNTSPMVTYSPYVTNSANSGGWQSMCPTNVVSGNGTSSWICDPDSAHTTSSFKASFELSFEGVGIHLIGNTTNNLGYDISLDGLHFPGTFRSNTQSLYSSVDLKPGPHTISLMVRRPASASNPGSLTLKEVVVDVGSGHTGATVIKKVIDDVDPSIEYYAPPGGNWTIGNAYPRTTQPEGIRSSTYHDSYWANATATISFKGGTGISVYGACYSHSRYAAYSASMDGSEEIQHDGTINLYSIGGDVKQRAGNCLRYFKNNLDADKDHELVLRVKDPGRLAVDWVEVFTVEGGDAFASGGQGGGGSNGIPLFTLLICLRRKQTEPQEIMTPAPNQTGPSSRGDTSFISTPFAPGLPRTRTDSHGTSGTYAWPQHQTLAPSTAKRRQGGTTARLSHHSGVTPLASPGLGSSSSYTESTVSGPGWPDSAGYQISTFNHGAPLGPYVSRSSDNTVRTGGLGLNPWNVYMGRGPMTEGAIVTDVDSGASLRPNYRIYAGDVASSAVAPVSTGPPAYEQVAGTRRHGTGSGRIWSLPSMIVPLASFLVWITVAYGWTYAESGIATMTHYTMNGTIAACGCTGGSTYYPTAALSSLAYGSDGSVGFGPSCGRCFNLTLLNTFLSTPPFYPNPTKSIVVKVTDLCPSISGWCDATESKPNDGGAWLNFDLVWPSVAIPEDWFPHNESFYGYKDFGVWNVSYQSVLCADNWAGGHDPAALGSVNNLGDSVCCPADPLAPNGTICPSSGPAPDTGTSGAPELVPGVVIWIAMLIVVSVNIHF